MQKLAGIITEEQEQHKIKMDEKSGNGLSYDKLVADMYPLLKNPSFDLQNHYNSEEELYNALEGKYIVSELIAYDLDLILEDYLIRNNNIVIDGVDYTDYYWESITTYVTNDKSITNFIRLLYPDIKVNGVYFVGNYEDLDTFFEMWDENSNLSMHTQSDIIELAQEAGMSQSDISYILDLPQVSRLEQG